MTARQKRGVGYIVSGVIFTVVGVVFIKTASTPDWVPLAVSVVGSIASVFGLQTVFPDTE